MVLNDFLTQTCSIYSITRTNNKWTQEISKVAIYSNIPCFMYKDNRKQSINSISSENQTWEITLMLEKDKINVKKSYRVEVVDPDLWNLWEFIIENVDKHRSFTWISAISLLLNRIENG